MKIRTDNSEESIRIRRSQSTLVAVGTGIMLLGVWSAIKAYSYILLRRGSLIEEVRSYAEEGTELTDGMLLAGVIVVFTIYVLIELGVRLFIGRSAIAEGKGHRSGKMYIPLTILLIIVTALIIFAEGYSMVDGKPDSNVTEVDWATSLVIDITSLVMMIEMVVSAFRVKKYKKTHLNEEGGHAA